MRRFGEFVNSLSGKYITAEDVGMETRDMDVILEKLLLLLQEFQSIKEVLEIHHQLLLMVFIWE